LTLYSVRVNTYYLARKPTPFPNSDLGSSYRKVKLDKAAMDYVEQRVAQEAAKPAGTTEFVYLLDFRPQPTSLTKWPVLPSTTLFTPLNIILVAVLVYTAYALLKPSPPAALPKEEPAVVFKNFTPQTLLPFNGEGGAPVYLAVRGRVFDVTKGRNFYGPGGPYANFAGRDASRGLAKGSFDEDMLTKDLEGPLDTLTDLGPDELEALQGWEDRFLEKYLVVGKLVAAADLGKE
jgi:membrane-associated progesterone receptor component